jgi:8-oxo-dGTP pyrophosphatase MutT (NUDIX family)
VVLTDVLRDRRCGNRADIGNRDVSFCPHAAGEAELTPLRVVAYVTRGDQLLVFEHRDLPEAGTQVPAGRLDLGELLEEGLARELVEEVGIEAQVVRKLGTVTRDHGIMARRSGRTRPTTSTSRRETRAKRGSMR